MGQETHHFAENDQCQGFYGLLVLLNQVLFNASKCLLYNCICPLVVQPFVAKLTKMITQIVPTYAQLS